jgi:hypothetical protein
MPTMTACITRTGVALCGKLRLGQAKGDPPMDFPSAAFGAATCVLAPLMSSQFTPAIGESAQQDQTMTATASAPSKSDACTASMDKAYAVCIAKGFFNITRVNCDCNQRNAPGAPWECMGTATCKK